MAKQTAFDFDAELGKVEESQQAIKDKIAEEQAKLAKAFEPLRAKLMARQAELDAEQNEIADQLATIDRKTGKTTQATRTGKRHRRTAEELAAEKAIAEKVLAYVGKHPNATNADLETAVGKLPVGAGQLVKAHKVGALKNTGSKNQPKWSVA